MKDNEIKITVIVNKIDDYFEFRVYREIKASYLRGALMVLADDIEEAMEGINPTTIKLDKKIV